MNLKTLQEKLEDRAHQDAEQEARKIVNGFPRYSHGQVSIPAQFVAPSEGNERYVVVAWFNLKESIRLFIEQKIYEERVDELTQAVLDAGLDAAMARKVPDEEE